MFTCTAATITQIDFQLPKVVLFETSFPGSWCTQGFVCALQEFLVGKKVLNDPDNHDDVITYLEPDVVECEVKWALGSITTNKASEGDGVPVELCQILQDDAVKVLYSICQQIWKTQQWPQA